MYTIWEKNAAHTPTEPNTLKRQLQSAGANLNKWWWNTKEDGVWYVDISDISGHSIYITREIRQKHLVSLLEDSRDLGPKSEQKQTNVYFFAPTAIAKLMPVLLLLLRVNL